MPGKELADAMDIIPAPQHTLLKAHKAFPRRAVSLRATPPSLTAHTKRDHDSEQGVVGKAAQIDSWIPEPEVIHLALDHSLPLTPPSILSEDEGTSWIDGPLSDDNKVTTRSVSSGINTPVIQRSPPTPETTPPRAGLQQRPAVHPYSLGQSTSTLTQSFRTARENLSSDDESSEPDSPSLQPSRQRWLKQSAAARLGAIGLGLGLELEKEDSGTPETTPKGSPKSGEFVTFDGTWGRSEEEASTPAHVANSPLIHTMRSNKRRASPATLKKDQREKEGVVPLSRSLSLRQRLEARRNSPESPSTEKFAKQIRWPLQDDDHFGIGAKVHDFDTRRFSQMSGTSTIEAKVIDSPTPKRRQTLRHTGKFSKRDSGGPHSNCNSLSSSYERSKPRKLRHAQSPDAIKRGSISSDVVLMDTPEHSGRPQENIPITLIPERRSSLGSSAPGSRRLSRTTSIASRQHSSRPTTAPEKTSGYFDTPGEERRTVSAKQPPVGILKTQNKVMQEPSSTVLAEAPVTSANTSRKVSRPTSAVAANGLSTGDPPEAVLLPQQVAQVDEPLETQDPRVQSISFDRSSMAEWSAVRPNSTQVTPFSLRSAHSSTPGTLEVNEATAINIYPHTNKSILVVQQLPRGDSESVKHSAIVASNASFALPAPQAPALHHQAKMRNLLESPLQNPREPPQPPDFKVIPPTPIPNSSSTRILDQNKPQSASAVPRNRFGRPITMVKRALSARRYSDAISSPLTRGLNRRNSTNPRPISYASDRDSKLHPFWRPRAFWDDLSDSDSDSEFGNDGPLVGNSLGMPTAHTVTRISAQPPRRANSLSQRLSNSLRFSRRNSSRRHSTAVDAPSSHDRRGIYQQESEVNRSYEFIQPEQKSDLVRDHERVPPMGYPVQFVGLKGLAEKMEKRKEKRQEGKREQLREKLRGSGVVVPAQGEPQGWGGGGYLGGV